MAESITVVLKEQDSRASLLSIPTDILLERIWPKGWFLSGMRTCRRVLSPISSTVADVWERLLPKGYILAGMHTKR